MSLLAKNLRKRAETLGLSNAEVARRCGLSERTYGNYVLGRTEPNLDALLVIAKVLGVTVDGLLQSSGVAEVADPVAERLRIAMAALSEADLELLAAQAEAIVALRLKK